MSEDRWLADALANLASSDAVRLGPGDDAAVVDAGPDGVVVTTDALVDGVHFVLADCGPEAAARKAVGVNLSDLAAMGAQPVGMVVAAVLPRPVDRTLFEGLMAGFRHEAERFDCPLLGGDTNTAEGPLVLSVTALGRPGGGGIVTRAGGRAGQLLSVTGPLGGSGAGRHLTPTPRLAAGEALARLGIATAMMDISDGLSRDLPRLAAASGVGAVVDAGAVPIHDDAEGDLERALHEGEDFELLVAHAALEDGQREALAAAGVTLWPIGRLDEGPGVRLEDASGIHPLPTGGYDHLAG